MNQILGAASVSVGVIVAALAFGGGGALQYLGALFGVAAAVLLGVPGVHPLWGFAAFFVANVAWLVYGLLLRLRGLVVQHVLLLVLALVGLWNWWLGPLVLASQ
ncbi:hypothetical protein [Variovorax sp.]|uniref:hypothetical protein n=1 Tax=Variovorax sp. TaxID=1871043 RepID=UPI003BACEBFB